MPTTVKSSAQVLREINAEILERSKYAKEQEKIINELIEAGNTRLMSLNHDIELAKKELRELKTDIRIGIQDKKLIVRDIKKLEAQVNNLYPNGVVANAF